MSFNINYIKRIWISCHNDIEKHMDYVDENFKIFDNGIQMQYLLDDSNIQHSKVMRYMKIKNKAFVIIELYDLKMKKNDDLKMDQQRYCLGLLNNSNVDDIQSIIKTKLHVINRIHENIDNEFNQLKCLILEVF